MDARKKIVVCKSHSYKHRRIDLVRCKLKSFGVKYQYPCCQKEDADSTDIIVLSRSRSILIILLAPRLLILVNEICGLFFSRTRWHRKKDTS